MAARLAPAATRARLIALYAVNYEIARVSETTKEPHVGAIRFAWWREAVKAVAAGAPAPAHPAAEALAAAHRESPLPLTIFEVMLDARTRDFEAQPFATWQEQTDYADATAGALMTLALATCGGRHDDLARDAGRAWALAGLLRARSFWEARGRSVFPAEARDREGAARLMENTARQAYARAKAAARGLSSELFPALGYAALVPVYLRKHERARIARQIALIGASLTGRI